MAVYPGEAIAATGLASPRAAKGWLELLAFEDAARELESIRPEFCKHSQVLEVRWALAANAGNWPEALAIADSLTQLMPDQSEGWIYQGSALNELNRPADAYAILLQGHERFPQDEIIAYDLACACCALGREDEAAEWIRQAIASHPPSTSRLGSAHPVVTPPLRPPGCPKRRGQTNGGQTNLPQSSI